MKLTRLPGTDGTRYRHPNGWIIFPVVRDWDARGLGGMAVEPKRTWAIKRRFARTVDAPEAAFNTLREARAWCDGTTKASAREEEK